MDYELIFSAVGILAFAGWGALLLSPMRPHGLILTARVLGIALSAAYVALFALGWNIEPQVSFDTLAGVINGLQVPGHMITAWTHFLAFDLLIGSWIVERARQAEIHHVLVIPCLFLTFLFGPSGFLLFMAVLAVKNAGSRQQG